MIKIGGFSQLPGFRQRISIDFPELAGLNRTIWTGKSGESFANGRIRFFSSSDLPKFPNGKIFVGFAADVLKPEDTLPIDKIIKCLMKQRVTQIPLYMVAESEKGLAKFLKEGYLCKAVESISPESVESFKRRFHEEIFNLMGLFEDQANRTGVKKNKMPISQQLGLINPRGLVSVAVANADGSKHLLSESIAINGETGTRQENRQGLSFNIDRKDSDIRHHRILVTELPNIGDGYPDLRLISQSSKSIANTGITYEGANTFYKLHPESNELTSYTGNATDSLSPSDANLVKFRISDSLSYQSGIAGLTMGKEQNQDT